MTRRSRPNCPRGYDSCRLLPGRPLSAFNSPCPLVVVDAHRSNRSLTSEVFVEPSHFLGEERKADSETALSSVVLLLLALALYLPEYLGLDGGLRAAVRFM